MPVHNNFCSERKIYFGIDHFKDEKVQTKAENTDNLDRIVEKVSIGKR